MIDVSKKQPLIEHALSFGFKGKTAEFLKLVYTYLGIKKPGTRKPMTEGPLLKDIAKHLMNEEFSEDKFKELLCARHHENDVEQWITSSPMWWGSSRACSKKSLKTMIC